MRLLSFLLSTLLLHSCFSGNADNFVEEHEKAVQEFWEANKNEILDFYLSYEEVNAIWLKKLSDRTDLHLGFPVDSIVSKEEREQLQNLLNDRKIVKSSIHVGATEGYTAEIYLPAASEEMKFDTLLTGLTYTYLDQRREDISASCYAFNSKAKNNEEDFLFDRIKIELISDKGSCNLYFQL
jgi:hypothetical protein